MRRLIFLLGLLTLCPRVLLGATSAYILGASGPSGAAADVFSDDVESNDFSAWTGELDSGTKFSTQAAPGSGHGSYSAMEDHTSTTAAFVYKTMGSDYTDSYAEFYFRSTAVTGLRASSYMWFGNGKNAASSEHEWVAKLYTDGSGDIYRFSYEYFTDGGSTVVNDEFSVAVDTWYKIRVRYKVASGAGADDGVFQVWRDDVSKANVTHVDNDTKAGVGRLNIGNMAADLDGTGSPDFHWDDVRFRQDASF